MLKYLYVLKLVAESQSDSADFGQLECGFANFSHFKIHNEPLFTICQERVPLIHFAIDKNVVSDIKLLAESPADSGMF